MNKQDWVVAFKHKDIDRTLIITSKEKSSESRALLSVRDACVDKNSLLPQRGRDESDSQLYERVYKIKLVSVSEAEKA